VKPGDLYLLCSDGLCGAVDDGAIAEVLGALGAHLDRAVDQMLRLALAAGGTDNITVVLARPVL
jgi:protein phosphatase